MEQEPLDPAGKEQLTAANINLELALIKIARALFEYIDSQIEPEQLGRLDPVFNEFCELANDYHNQTGMLHPDLAFNLAEWASLKDDLLTASSEEQKRDTLGKGDNSSVSPEWVAEYRGYALKSIEELESELGLDTRNE